MKNIEVEVRGPLTEEHRCELVEKFEKEGKFIENKDRAMVCYPDPESGSLVEDLNTDIRVRNANGIPELIVKKGKWGATDESRREYSLKGKPGQFHEMIEMLGVMGFCQGMAIVRLGKVYMYKGVEFSLMEVPGHSYFFEAEIMSKAEEKEDALRNIKKVCKDLGLEVFTEKAFFEHINVLNKEANIDFKIEDFSEDYFFEKFGIRE